MPVTPPVKPENAPEGVTKIYERIKETIGHGDVPLGYQMMGNCEPYLQDSYMNYRKFVADGAGKLDAKTREAIALATCSAMSCAHCVRSHAKDAQEAGWSEDEVAEILAVTATCAMYNTYYKFRDLAGDPKFESYAPMLRAHTFTKVSLEQKLVELINVVVSNINGCSMCTTGHVKKSLDLGLTHDDIDEAVKISALTASFNTYHRTQ